MKLKNSTADSAFQYGMLAKRIFPYIKPIIPRIIASILIAIPVGLLDGVVSFSLKPYMDYVVGKQNLVLFGYEIPYMTLAFAMPIAIILFAAIQGVCKYLNYYLSCWIGFKITNSVKYDLFRNLVYMDTSFYDENSSGIILSRYVTDADLASKGIAEEFKCLIVSIFGTISLVAVMLYSSWLLALVGVFVLGFTFIPIALIRKRIKVTSNKNLVIVGEMTTTVNETYIGNKVVSGYNLQEKQINKFNTAIDNIFNVSISLTKRMGWLSPIMYIIASLGVAFVLFFGTKLIYDGKMTAGAFASFVTSLLLLYKPVKSFGEILANLQTAFVSMSRVFELFDLTPSIKDKQNAGNISLPVKEITFKDVRFEYEKDTPVLNGINLNVKSGETLAIVGNSGGGKSTLVNLIPRFYDVTGGAIYIDGTDIRDIKLSELRNTVSEVFQDNFLFTGTIRENIMLAKPSATEAELKTAIEASHLDEFISSLPQGLDTVLGERGMSLSGGQRQRVAIARAMIRNTPIVILDEATSALDNESEAVVQKALDNLMKDKTVFVIAHRLSTVQNADRIVVINDGCVVEEGTHESLLDIPEGHYKHLYEMQFKNSEG